MNVTLNKKTDKLFLAIGKEGQHSFIFFGVYEQNAVKHLFCRVGKSVNDNVSAGANFCLTVAGRLKNFFFSHVQSHLISERTRRKKLGAKPISYQAYEATYAQYLELIRLLESLQTKKNQFSCFKPIYETEDEIVLQETTAPAFSLQNHDDDLKNGISQLSLNNTCRHTAMQLVDTILRGPVSNHVSSTFFVDLPNRTELDYGVPCSRIPFYVLPANPLAYPELSIEKKKIINKLYTRMESLLLLRADSHETIKKFNCLKELYIQTVGASKEQTLGELLESIQVWKQHNKGTLSVLRQTYFWDTFFKRESATMSLINEIEQDLIHAPSLQGTNQSS